MPNRRIAGGYELSSDDPDSKSETRPPKKTKYNPPRLSISTTSASSKTKPPTFNFPRPAANVTPQASGDTSSRSRNPVPVGPAKTSGSAVGSLPTPKRTPALSNNLVGSLSDNEIPTPIGGGKSKGRAPVPAPSERGSDLDENPVPAIRVSSGSGTGSSRQLLEQRIDEISSQLQSLETRNDEQHRETQGQLTTIMKAIENIQALVLASQAPVLSPSDPVQGSASVPSGVSKVNPKVNPPVTPELRDLIKRVVTGFSARGGTKAKGDKVVNTKKKHARNVFWATFSVNGEEELGPPFFDDDGRPNYFPEAFVDPATGYCQPCPNWGLSMSLQMQWVPTLLVHWTAMIPSDTGQTSTMLRSVSTEEALIYLHDGPFRSARLEWGKKKKTDDELEIMRSQARQDKRTETKTIDRSEFRPEVPALMAPEYDWAFHQGMMSRDISDNEGEIDVYRNEGRALWLTSFYEGADAAKQRRAKSRRHHKNKTIVPVPAHIPQLEHGKGQHKRILPIALCGFSKQFRRKDPELFERSSHLIDSSITAAPDIMAFLEKYPKDDPEPESEPEAVEPEEREEVGDGENVVSDPKSNVGNEGEPEDVVFNGPLTTQTHQSVPEVNEEPSTAPDSLTPAPATTDRLTGSVIDPSLGPLQRPTPITPADTPTQGPDDPRASATLNTSVMRDTWGNPVGAHMPPPPELQNQNDLDAKRNTQPEASANGTQGEQQEVIPKKRGRPPGVKNKPKEPKPGSMTKAQHAALGESEASPSMPRKRGRPRKVVE